MKETIYEKLKEVAREKGHITYKELAEALGLDWRKNYGQCRQIFRILGDICDAEVKQGHPMLSAVAVGQDTKMPGSGFFTVAHDLDLYRGASDRAFWISERNKVWDYWSSH